MKTKPFFLNFTAFPAILAVTGFVVASAGCSGSSTKADTAKPAVPVTVATAQQKDMPVQLTEIGAVRAYASVAIKARVDGQLASIGFKQGDEVKKDQLIFTIDPRPFEVQLERDAALWKKAESDRQRTDALAGTKAVSASEVEQNRANAASLKATVESDKLQLSYCHIQSPVDGRIGVLQMDAGNMVKTNDTVLAVVNQIKPIYVDFAVPERELASIRQFMAAGALKVEATIPHVAGPSVVGLLSVINNMVDSTTGTVLLRAIFTNDDERLWPGQFVNVTLTLDTLRGATVVPAQAVQTSQQGLYVFVVKPDLTVVDQSVEVAMRIGEETVLGKGLQPKEIVVTNGQLRLIRGAKVQIVNGEAKGETKAEASETK